MKGGIGAVEDAMDFGAETSVARGQSRPDAARAQTGRHRSSMRLHGYDYAQPGAYFITICTQDRACLFGDIVDGKMCINEVGRVVVETWEGLPAHCPDVLVDEFVVMPNHVHGIIVLGPTGWGDSDCRRRHGVPELIRALKTFSARRINQVRGTPGSRVWQRHYYDHILRNDDSLARIRQYIRDNPGQWVPGRAR